MQDAECIVFHFITWKRSCLSLSLSVCLDARTRLSVKRSWGLSTGLWATPAITWLVGGSSQARRRLWPAGSLGTHWPANSNTLWGLYIAIYRDLFYDALVYVETPLHYHPMSIAETSTWWMLWWYIVQLVRYNKCISRNISSLVHLHLVSLNFTEATHTHVQTILRKGI